MQEVLRAPLTPLAAMACAAAISWIGSSGRANQACEACQARVEANAAARLAAQSERHRSAEKALRDRIDADSTRHQLEIADLERSKHDLAARLRAGAVRVSVPATACLPAAGGGASAADQTARAELATETALALDRIAADGDAAIIELNHCLAAYDAARAAVEATR
jgi:prophage endopeptidase